MPDLETRPTATVPDDATLREVTRLTARAPSVHTTQPSPRRPASEIFASSAGTPADS